MSERSRGSQKGQKSLRDIAHRLASETERPPYEAEVDLHGKRVDEALPMVDKLIDEQYASGGTVRVICGYGTETIKRAVKKYLDEMQRTKRPYEIESYKEIGPYIYVYM